MFKILVKDKETGLIRTIVAGMNPGSQFLPRYLPAHRWVHRQKDCGPLSCFSTYEGAEQFITRTWGNSRLNVNFFIYPCSIKGDMAGRASDLYLPDACSEVSYYELPIGTVLCESIKIDSSRPVCKGWKIVGWCQDSSEFISINAQDANICIYNVGEWTSPNKGNGPLCVFDKKENAENFLERMRGEWTDATLFECIYVPVSEHNQHHGWTKLWTDEGYTCRKEDLPKGTVLAEKVMLI